jgi:hypothetical protein
MPLGQLTGEEERWRELKPDRAAPGGDVEGGGQFKEGTEKMEECQVKCRREISYSCRIINHL